MKTFVLFPAGKETMQLLNEKLFDDCECLFVCDNDSSKVGKQINGIKICKPEKLLESEFERIIICTANYDIANGIRIQLRDMGISGNKIFYSYGVPSSLYCRTVLDEYFQIDKKETIPFEMKPAVIYQDYRGETYKSVKRRQSEGFYDKYIQGLGIDIGYGSDIISEDACGWDIRNGDAQYLEGIEDEVFDYVYSSHCLEHIYNVRIALKNWFRVLKKGGYLIIAVPERDLYEKKKMLPSQWNLDHKHMFLLGNKDEIDTLDIIEEIRESLKNYKIVYAKTCDEGHTIDDSDKHSDGEYQIELVTLNLHYSHSKSH